MATASAPLSCAISSSFRATKMRLSIGVAQTSSRSQLCLFLPLSSWNGLKNRGLPSAQQYLCFTEKKRKCHGKIVYASLFGVGAPEALVIGVVALLVFGPKGLAEVARNLGKTLRSFQPTIRELQEVSREFKSTLEREIGLDEVAAKTNYADKSALKTEIKEQPVVDPNGKPSTGPKTYDELFKITENQLAALSAEKSGVEEQAIPDSEKSESQATSTEKVQGLDVENSQEEPPATVEDAALVSSEVTPTAYPSELGSPAQVASETII